MKHGLILLLVLFLSFSAMVAAVDLNGFTTSLENILTFPTVENQAVSAPVFGGMAVLSVCLSEQVVIDNNTIMPDIGLEMEIIVEPYNNLRFAHLTIIDESRGGYLHFASHYKQLSLIIQ